MPHIIEVPDTTRTEDLSNVFRYLLVTISYDCADVDALAVQPFNCPHQAFLLHQGRLVVSFALLQKLNERINAHQPKVITCTRILIDN